MLDLADRVSRAAVAALDLAPFDDRFARLSRQVLAGGASRFAKVIADGEPVDFVVPVGLLHDRLDYGALVVQKTQVGLLWRDDAGLDHVRTATLGAGTSYSAVDLGGETWTRFDLPADGVPLTFLTPPVSSTLLRTTLARLLGASPGAAAPVSTPAPAPEPAPVVMPNPPLVPTSAPSPGSVPAPDSWDVAAPAEIEFEATRVHAFPGYDDVTTVHPLPDGLFRPDTRQPAASAPAPAVTNHQAPLMAVTPPAAISATAHGSGISVQGFLLGFIGALAVGGIALLLRLLLG